MIISIIFGSLFFSNLFAATPLTGHNITVYYWGQDDANLGEDERLRDYCGDDQVDIIVLAFIYIFGLGQQWKLDLSKEWGENIPGTNYMNLSYVGDDIKYCQSRGKQILLSLGGDAGNYGLQTDDEAIKLANDLKNSFGSGTSNIRMFGSAVVDGYDLDIEGRYNGHYTAFVNEMRRIEPGVLISAAPQCVYPDASLQPVLDDAFIDYVWIQFYNNYCEPGSDFNFNTWNEWAATKSQNKNVRIFFGTPGGSGAAGSGWQGFSRLPQAVDASRRASPDYFGGIMMWDASDAVSTKNNGETYMHFARGLLR